MIAYRTLAAAALVTAVLAAPLAAREPRDIDLFPRFVARQESNFERNAREFKPAFERQQRERTHEQMRDKTLDNRLRVGTGISFGAGRDGLNVIISH